jgi:DNA-binding XRE family transcriptional regulator
MHAEQFTYVETPLIDEFAPVKDAGIRQVEFAKIANVSRLTANNWMNGKGRPHALHAEKITALVERIRTCVQDGRLPVSPRLKGDARLQEIEAVLRNV